MPYNTTPIRPRKEVTGQVQLPLSRVKKIIAVDPDINICSNNAAFAITMATELFIQYIAEQGHNMAKLDRKPRRNIQYKDLSAAVTYKDNLEFLDDTIPKTVPYKQIKQKAAETRAKLSGSKTAGDQPHEPAHTNGKKQKTLSNGLGAHEGMKKPHSADPADESAAGAGEDEDVQMTG
ncbi:hypothetical protein M406DRAFT_275450 [Cryphonectria parasitica EP155]|uniref:Transcription factor CBF/NF-Y/archaeal histone domain-containing protein n=1 Tax=Cryphonectria parasitica (strain ATCC 38755 / EP155) TaxID=660469 RepID=A0A9P4Y783_CRYP1|nr:uncharacterized protein M406DRAFT_275450 [Cryphonectria parasitica EP155]KAF3767771.1 hypothetical protein M406DRAFT_275450 [Cryphonectria parasitica EP155]